MKTGLLIILIIFVLAFWLGNLAVGIYFFDNWDNRGQFGDLFGSINALFSGLAFLGLIYAILLQRKELSLQREELKLQREEMAGSRAELKDQVSAIVGQIQVSAEIARIESIKMDSEKISPGCRNKHIEKINEAANHIDEIAEELKEVALREQEISKMKVL